MPCFSVRRPRRLRLQTAGRSEVGLGLGLGSGVGGAVRALASDVAMPK